MLYRPLNLQWCPLLIGDGDISEDYARSQRAERRLARILNSWRDTPYAAGQGHRGVGTDCVRATVMILAEWMRWQAPKLNTLPADAALHSPITAVRGLRAIRRALPANRRIRTLRVQPGDVLITGHPKGGPGHAIIVGTRENTLWQATQGAGYQECGWALPPEYSKLYGVLRFTEREGAI